MKPRYVLAKMLSDGRTAWYWNPPRGMRTTGLVPEALGNDQTAAFQRAVRLNAQLDEIRQGSGGPAHGTVSWGIARYLSAGAFQDLAPSSQRVYLQAIRRIENVFGKYMAADISPRHANSFYEALRRPGKRTSLPRLALAAGIIRVARLLWDHFLRALEITHINPFRRVRAKGAEPRRARWTRDQVVAFVAAARGIGHHGMAAAALLAFELCQRQGDMLALSWVQIDGLKVHIIQSKTGAEIVPEMPAYLRNLLRELHQESAKVITRPDGKPWCQHVNEFRRVFRQIADRAGIPGGLRFMDLRRSGITEMAEADATDNEILSVSGHKDRAMLKVYALRTPVQAANGLEKRRKHASIR